jgi:hypothetical protein
MVKQSHKKISRRDAMKILTAAAGATALANIPSKWSKPGLEVGVLPAHAQTSVITVLHSLAAGGAQAVGFCYPTGLTSTVTISPADSGILMRYTINPDASVTISAPAALTGTALTGATGTASLTFTAADISGMGTITVVWDFANAIDGTGSSSQLFTATGC